jgi:hypothetical protein
MIFLLQGLGSYGGMTVAGHTYFAQVLSEIIEELLKPLEEVRICIIEQLLNKLQAVIISEKATKIELHDAVETYEPPINSLSLNLDALERRVLHIQREKAAGRWPSY